MIRRGIKRTSSIFQEDKKEEDGEETRVKIRVVEEPNIEQESSTVKVEEEGFKIPPPSKHSFLIKAMERKEQKKTTIEEQSVITDYHNNESLERRAKNWLKSLGWKEGQSVGKNGKDRPVSPVLMLLNRPQFLGLGAKPPALGVDDDSVSYLEKSGEERVEIKKGVHKGLSGIITSKKEYSEIKVKLDLSGIIVNINDEPPKEITKLILGLMVRIISRNENYYKTGHIMDILADNAVIIKCHNHLLQLSPSELVCVHPDAVGQKVYIMSRNNTGTVQYLEPPLCTVQENEEKSFLSVLISDCCCLVLD